MLCKPTCSFDPPFCRRHGACGSGSRARIDCGGTPADGSTAPYYGGEPICESAQSLLLLCGYTLAGPPSRTKCGTCSIYGVHCSPKWLVRALHKDSSRLDVLGEDFGLVEDYQKQARERFDRITAAYEAIKKQRGIK